MSANDTHSSQATLSAFLTAEQDCSYLPNQQARFQVISQPEAVDDAMYSQLMQLGFRHSGMDIYRPRCDNCHACMPMRIPAAEFRPSRTQKRTWKQHHHLQVRILDLVFEPRHYALYKSYQAQRHPHDSMSHDSPEQYAQFLLESPVTSQLIEFSEGEQVKMVCVVDILPVGISAAYTFYADDAGASYGTYGVLWQIDLAQRLGLAHVYLGYWIEACPKMRYKSKFQPHDVLLNNQWVRPKASHFTI